MAVVTDSSLLSAAHEIVSDFLDKKASLNDGVIKKQVSWVLTPTRLRG